ncbi:hypothetical protein [Streptomyces sp. NPDC058240]|uniref:hypothetical protein n=1 Tax=Streptomyces sp. NPDC058240 TaxID=3346396 RepID=UPI0036ED1770
MGYVVREEWHKHYTDGKNFRQLGEAERALLAEHTPVPDGGAPLRSAGSPSRSPQPSKRAARTNAGVSMATCTART